MTRMLAVAAALVTVGCADSITAAGVAVRGFEWPAVVAFSVLVVATAYVVGKVFG